MQHPTLKMHKYAEGFTLVETLVSITVLLLVIIGPISAAQKGIQRAYYANEQLSAVFIAQEAIEAVRKERDDQALTVWQDGSGDTWNWNVNDCDVCDSTPVEIDKDGVIFTREVAVEEDVSGNSARITVRVAWANTPLFGDSTPPVILQTYVYDHYQRFEP